MNNAVATNFAETHTPNAADVLFAATACTVDGVRFDLSAEWLDGGAHSMSLDGAVRQIAHKLGLNHASLITDYSLGCWFVTDSATGREVGSVIPNTQAYVSPFKHTFTDCLLNPALDPAELA